MDYISLLKRYCKSSIRIKINGKATNQIGCSRFGGKPDVPVDFSWPVYKDKPLTFMLQLSCAEMASLDINHELPNTGLLSFFYALDNECFGYDNRDMEGFRVFWFDQNTPLAAYACPVTEHSMLPCIGISFDREVTYPHLEDFTILLDRNIDDYDKFEAAEQALGIKRKDTMHRTLGWADLIQNNTTWRCEILSQGYSFGEGYKRIPRSVINASKLPTVYRWKLLLQIGTVQEGPVTLMFGDAGKLYFYIPEEDLKACRFDRVCGEMQCY